MSTVSGVASMGIVMKGKYLRDNIHLENKYSLSMNPIVTVIQSFIQLL
jgi:hypothetical protein